MHRLVPVPVQSPDSVDATGNYYGAPLVFDRPVKAVFSADGSTAYVLNCGPECGGIDVFDLGAAGGADDLSARAAIRQSAEQCCPARNCATTSTELMYLAIPGGASNALVDSIHDVCGGPAAATGWTCLPAT